MEFLGASLILLASLAQLPLLVGLIKPTWIRLQSRKQVGKWWVISFVSFAVGGAFLPPPDPAAPVAVAATVEQVQAPAPVPESIPDPDKVEADKLRADAALAKAETEKLKAELEQAKQATDQANAAAELAKQQADAAELARVAAEQAKAEQARADAEKIQQQTVAVEQAQAAAEQAKQQAVAVAVAVEATPVVAPLALLSAAPTPAPAEKPAESPPAAPACKLSGKVVSVADGDTITVLDADKKQHKIRMAGIDAPEKAQPFGTAAKKYLSDLVASKDVCIDWSKEDKYQRKVGKVLLDGEDVDLKMVSAGLAWHYKKYQDEQSPADRDSYAAAHDKAQAAGIGLWSEPSPIEPGEWRGGARPVKVAEKVMPDKIEAAPVKQLTGSGAMSCGAKRYCKDMDSCAEACFYLNQCNLKRLDGDSDGRPCEKLCGRAC